MTNAPHIDDIVKDTDSNKIGRVMGFVGPYVQLRPVGGGREWDAQREHLESVDAAEALSVRVAEVNVRSRRGAAVATGTVLANPENPRSGARTPSAECELAKRPGYEDLHDACRQTHDVFLPGAIGIVLMPCCGCRCHTATEGTS
jgi:hypothetical protein